MENSEKGNLPSDGATQPRNPLRGRKPRPTDQSTDVDNSAGSEQASVGRLPRSGGEIPHLRPDSPEQNASDGQLKPPGATPPISNPKKPSIPEASNSEQKAAEQAGADVPSISDAFHEGIDKTGMGGSKKDKPSKHRPRPEGVDTGIGSSKIDGAQDAGKSAASTAETAANALSNPKKALKDAALDKATEAIPGGEEAKKTMDAALRMKELALRVKGAALATKGFAVALFNPYSLIAIAVIIVLGLGTLVVVSTVQVVGRNSNADNCNVDGTVKVDIDSSGSTWQTRAPSIAKWLTSNKFTALGGQPMNTKQAAAIIGNWAQESGVNPASYQNKSGYFTDSSPNSALQGGSDVADGNAAGLAQWDGSRRKSMAKHADGMGKKWTDAEAQLDFFKKEFEGYDWKAAGFTDSKKSVDDLVGIFEKVFERAGIPVLENRIKAANEFMGFYKDGYSPAGGDSCTKAGPAVGADCSPVPSKQGWCYPMKPNGSWVLNTYAGHPFEAKDIPGPEGTPVYAVISGTVQSSSPVGVGSWCPVPGKVGTNQNTVVIQLATPVNGINTVLYTHLRDQSPLKPGQKISAGDFVGYMGTTGCSTGSHLHIEFTSSGQDPRAYFGNSF